VKKSSFPRDVLNRLRWSEDRSLDEAEVVILHRGAPENRKSVSGKEIISLGHMFFEIPGASIPYHRVLEIWYGKELIFERPAKEPEDKKLK